MAQNAGLDLVLVSERSVPPVVRIMNFGKLQYEQKKNLKAQRKNTIAQKIKEVKFHINVDKNDLPVSLPDINAYPSIMMWPAGRKAEPPEVFHGNSSISDFVEFVSKAASHSFQETSLDLQKVKDKVTEKVNELAAMFAKKRNE